MESNQTGELQSGTMLGERYLITSILVKGGMGVVYAAKDMKLGGMLRAVKVPSGSGGSRGAEDREAFLLTQLNHPLLPQIVDYVRLSSNNQVALVMDYFPGQTLHDCYERAAHPFVYKHILHIGLQLCSALSYLHERQPSIIHLDIKPSNVMINQQGGLKLIDFGISSTEMPSMGERTAKLGTAEFAAPERIAGLAGDAKTDIYGLGALLHYLTGSRTWQEDRRQTMKQQYPSAFWAVLNTMMQPDPANRFQSMEAVQFELRRLEKHRQKNESTSSGDDPLPWKLRSQAPLVSLISLSAGAGATFLTFVLTELLVGQGMTVTAAEIGASRPEWYTLLSNHTVNLPHKLRFEAEPRFNEDFTLFRRADHTVSLLAMRQQSSRAGASLFDHAWGDLNEDIRIADLSSHWREAHSQAALDEACIIIAVGDPAVYKWQASELAALDRLNTELAERGGALIWIANKAVRFDGLTEWLQIFPAKPLAIVPELPPAKLWQARLSGRLLPQDKAMIRLLVRELQPVIRHIKSQIST